MKRYTVTVVVDIDAEDETGAADVVWAFIESADGEGVVGYSVQRVD